MTAGSDAIDEGATELVVDVPELQDIWRAVSGAEDMAFIAVAPRRSGREDGAHARLNGG